MTAGASYDLVGNYQQRQERVWGEQVDTPVARLVPRHNALRPHQFGHASAEDAFQMLITKIRENGWIMSPERVQGVGALIWITDQATFGLYAEVDMDSAAKTVTFHIAEGLCPPALEALREERPKWFVYKTASSQIEARLAAALERNLDALATMVRELLVECGQCTDGLNNAQAVALFNEL